MANSESVWYDEVNLALKELAESTVKAYDEDKNLVPVKVVIRKPDEDFKLEVYPCVTIYPMGEQWSTDRVDSITQYLVKRDPDTHTGIFEDVAEPFYLTYRIELWSVSERDISLMSRLWLGNVKHFYNLSLKDVSGNPRSSFMRLSAPIQRSDIVTASNRIFRSVMTYRISVELDEKVESPIYIVTEETDLTVELM